MTRQWKALAADPEFATEVARAFPSLAVALATPHGRRHALRLMAASFALAGLGGCDPGAPAGHIVPAVIAPPDIIPGVPNFYATTASADGYATGTVVQQVMGRPIKVDGNPAHPASLGASDIHAQAMILDFYDPDRGAGISHRSEPSDRSALLAALAAERARAAERRGEGLRILVESTASPTLSAQLDAVLALYPAARLHRWDAVSRDAVRQGARLAYGTPLELVVHPERADVILAIDSDLIDAAPGHLAHARAFARRRNPTRTEQMSRIYAIEPSPTLIGAAADHRFVADITDLHAALRALAAGLLGGATGEAPPWVAPLLADLRSAQGRALIHVGPHQPAETHALVHALNEALGGRGATYDLIAPVLHQTGDTFGALVADMAAGRVDSLLILGGNPVFSATPAFRDALARVRFSLSLSQLPDETAAASGWFVPETHPFETWSDGRGFEGTASIQQPLALPLYDGSSVHELLALVAGPASPTPLEMVRGTWRDRLDEAAWHDALALGIVAGTQAPLSVAALRSTAHVLPPAPQAGLALLFRPDPNLRDGRHANNAWLQELPRPLTKLVWDNPLLIPPSLARERGLVNGQVVTLAAGAARMEAPVWIMPGQAADTLVALLGYGRRTVGAVGANTGFDFFPLRNGEATVTLLPTDRHVALACTDHHDVLDAEAGDIVRHTTLAQFATDPPAPRFQAVSLYGDTPPLAAQAWGMSIDLNACIGCNACVVACQAENNVPVVGKQQVLHGREMHWLRIDRYYEGQADAPDSFFQPMLCMHCEAAPCEVVCPVGATVHDHEGLNVMVYNRCVGTRFCSNNCPYKVRRFNYFAYAHEETRPAVSRNPDVTVRARGVMEKCTFCVQKVAAARIAADSGDRPIRDGEVVTACQAACPTQAIAFGNINDHDSQVAVRKRSRLDYAVLEERSTKPRVTYEARVRNPNPIVT